MTDFSELNSSFSYSVTSINEDAAIRFSNADYVENIDNNNYPIRCSDCSNIAILNADFKKNHYITICENNHKNEFNSFSEFISGANKDLFKILCHECHKSNDEINLFKCHNCNLFFCNDCKINHIEENNHQFFVEIDKIDCFCAFHNEKFKYFNKDKNHHICCTCYKNLNNKNNNIEIEKLLENKQNINNEYKKVVENIKICKNIEKLLVDWLNELNNKIKKYCETLNNYCLTQKAILYFLNDENQRDIYNNNFNALMNYKAFSKNNNNINIYIQQINNKINNIYSKNPDFEKMSNNYIQILNSFNDINFIVNSEKVKDESLRIVEKEVEVKYNTDGTKKKKFPKLENMKRNKIGLSSEIKCLSSINEEKTLVVGLKSGKIQIIDFQEKEIKMKLEINEFNNEIKSICNLDTFLFAATDGKTNIKIIELENNLKNYKVIETLNLMEDSGNIYTMVNLPFLSYNKKRHYFCTGDEKHILIWKSNKQPKNIKMPEFDKEIIDTIITEESYSSDDMVYDKEGENEEEESINNDEPLHFTLVKDINLNTLTRCIIEVNEKYIVAACTSRSIIKFIDVQRNFEVVKEKQNIPITCGNNVLSLLSEKDKFIVACKDGFRIISTKKFELNKIQCKYMVTSLLGLNKNIILSCGVNQKERKFRQHKINGFRSEFSKYSEKNLHDIEVWHFKVANNRIFYSNNNFLYILE